jgi:hypothetical protein
MIAISITAGLRPSFEDGSPLDKLAGTKIPEISLNVPKRDVVSTLVRGDPPRWGC